MYPQATVDFALRLSAIGVLDQETAKVCGVSIGAIRHWRSGRRRASSGRASPKANTCPHCHGRPLDKSAYAYLLGLYLGDGHIVRRPRDVYVLAIACSDDWQQGCTMVKSYSKHWPCLFPQHGPGRKHHRKIELREWQEIIVRKFPGEFAKGLFHSDGWRGVNRVRRPLADGDRWYEYPRYLFGNESGDILRLCGEALDRLGVEWRFSRRNSISVARREAVARLDEFVGPKY